MSQDIGLYDKIEKGKKNSQKSTIWSNYNDENFPI